MKIGVVGTGTMGKLHLNAWSNMKAVTISGILGRDKRLVDQLAEKYKSNTYMEYEELLKTDIDVIDICLPTYLHKEFVSKAAQHGKHIICEKPLALNLDECREILEICHTWGVQLFVGHTLRFSPEYKHAHDQVKRGVIGEPGVVRLSRGGPYPLGRDSWYQDEGKSGGVILDLGIHEFDWVRWTFGEVERVMAKQVKRKGENGNSIEYALVTLRMLSGTIAHMELSWAKETFESSFEIAGNKGMLTHSDRESYPITLKIKNEEEQNNGGVALPKSIGTKSPLQLQLEHFTKCLENAEKPIISAEDAMKAVEIAVAAIESVKSGQPVSLLTKKEVF
ncbi:Gfo/Idh/MocA family protein [Metabacillus bambusae]|uniref:Gfo/Idh/MocA family oxidoreductase n=1 Tax=Metabacillus bambusae TaxID=2795218 RepID=A0ABS3N994_9BACI|nr:Gfo/Idh/MocA family oxidoreductase [Metabacillus bambusae]MBO1514851.1 Gfo/Idh/MocA family oxidoreductase [Metabacillus bambusae]